MRRHEAMKKAKRIVNNDKRKTILEKRLARLEELTRGSSSDDAKTILREAAEDGYLSWEDLSKHLMAAMTDDQLWYVCKNLGLDDEFNEALDTSIDKSVTRTSKGHNAYSLCRMIISDLDMVSEIGEYDIDEYLDRYYMTLNDDDRQTVHDCMDEIIRVVPGRRLSDKWNESIKRQVRRPVRSESAKKPAKRFRK